MILHVALFQWKTEVTGEDVEALTEALQAMAAGIPEIRGYRCGPNLRLRPSPADYAVAAVVDDESALSAYLDHPEHVRVYTEHLSGMIAERQASQMVVPAGISL